MYLSRTNSLVDISLYLLLTGAWVMGGYLLVRYAFHLRRVERVVAGLAVGFLLFISMSNLLAHLPPLTYAFWGSSILILLAAIACAWKSRLHPWFEKSDFFVIPLLVSLAAITLLFTLILRGGSIFDEYQHLPLISIMAAGEIPPHFYLNPDFILLIIMGFKFLQLVWYAWLVFFLGQPGM
jgi:hypothetical protein